MIDIRWRDSDLTRTVLATPATSTRPSPMTVIESTPTTPNGSTSTGHAHSSSPLTISAKIILGLLLPLATIACLIALAMFFRTYSRRSQEPAQQSFVSTPESALSNTVPVDRPASEATFLAQSDSLPPSSPPDLSREGKSVALLPSIEATPLYEADDTGLIEARSKTQ